LGLLQLPKVDEAKPYRIELGFRSEVGVVSGFKKNNVSDAEVRLFHSITSAKARMDISYVDLAVARSFEATISSWYDGLEKNVEQPFRGFSRILAPVVGVSIRIAAIVAAAILLTYTFSSRVMASEHLYPEFDS
jgi:hypothetical protein